MKNDSAIRIRMPSDFITEVLQVSEKYGTTASGLARLLLERFLQAHNKHGGRLAYPPQFAYHAAEAKPEIVLQQKPMVAADTRSTYGKGKKGAKSA